MRNIINAICDLVISPKVELVHHYKSNNRANSMGDALEEYVKDLFAGTVDEKDEQNRLKEIEKTFSYLGNASNPPDSMIRGGDAIEVKKLEGFGDLALNSSHPKRKLRIDNPKINQHCRECEDWAVKDMLYIVGRCDARKIKNLFMVYGDEYCADIETYSRIESTISKGLESLENVELAETNELGRLNKIDPLGITNMRIRGMWTISHPVRVFDYVYAPDNSKEFNFMALLNEEKYNSFDNINVLEELIGKIDGLNIEKVKIKNPNNPAQLIDCRLITFSI